MTKNNKVETSLGLPLIRSVGHHAGTPNHSGKAEGPGAIVSIQELIARDAREFLLQVPGPTTRFAFYRALEKMDPEVKIAKNYLALMIQRSYLGPRMDESDKSYQATPDFLSNVNIILSEMQFASRIGSIAKDLIRHGNAFVRVRRTPGANAIYEDEEFELSGTITNSEIIPPDNITILSQRYIENYKDFKGVINAKDYYCIAEKESRKDDDPFVVVFSPEDEPRPDKDGKPPEILLPARDILHVAWDAEGTKFIDSHGRDTYNIWGESVYESIIVYVKAKLTLTTDYLRWMRNGMPRWMLTANLEDTLKLSNYAGTTEQKIVAAQAAADKIFKGFEDALYYWDDNPDSPTYRNKIPVEPDAVMTLDSRCSMDQKGAASAPDASVMNFIKTCDQAIASAMGVPMSLFGYESGSTYAIGRITSKFMAAYGGGLLRAIEIDVKDFLRREFDRRGGDYTDEDFENLYFEYDRDDVEEMLARNNAELVKSQRLVQLATAASAMYSGGMITLNEARKMVFEGSEELKEFMDTILDGGDSLRPLQPALPSGGMFGTAFSQQAQSINQGAIVDKLQQSLEDKLTLKLEEPEFEEKVYRAISDAFVFHIEDIARKVERGEIKPSGRGDGDGPKV